MNIPINSASSLPKRRCVLVCQHRSCSRNGSEAVLKEFRKANVAGVFASGSDCMGQCASGPTVRVMPDGIWYCRVKVEDVAAVVAQHLEADQPVEALLHPRFHPREEQGAIAESAEIATLSTMAESQDEQ